MHSTIYEITQEQLERDEWASESNFYEDPNVDYTDLWDDESREQIINDLDECDWFNALFTKGEEPDTIVFKGRDALQPIKEAWYKEIQDNLEALKESDGCDTYRLRKAINNPFAQYTLFCLPDWAGDKTSYPREFMELLNTLEDGTVLYINSVLDYHW